MPAKYRGESKNVSSFIKHRPFSDERSQKPMCNACCRNVLNGGDNWGVWRAEIGKKVRIREDGFLERVSDVSGTVGT